MARGIFRDLLGQKFGRLTVQARGLSRKGATWDCVCVCGKALNVTAKHLVQGNVRSCGCLRADLNRTKFDDPATREKHAAGLQRMWERRHARMTAANQKAARLKKLEPKPPRDSRPAATGKFSAKAAADLAKAWK
jgi:hypothetical protein